VLTLIVWIGLTVAFFFPTKAVLDPSLDYSNYGSYSYFTAEGFHYGSEVMPMCGPYGFVMYGFLYAGHLFWERLGAELILKGVLAALALWHWRAARAAPVLRCLWLGSLALFMMGIEDYPEDWLILLSGLWLIRHVSQSSNRYFQPLLITVVLAFAALIKGTHLVLTIATLTVALLPALVRRDWKQILMLGGGFTISLFGWWLLAGQRLGDMPAYIHGILELSSGYNLAMPLEEGAGTFWRGASLTLFLIGACLVLAVHRRRQIAVVSGLLLLAGFTFLKWKHGFVRADGHIFIFFAFGAVACSTWMLLPATLDPKGIPLTGWGRRISLAFSAGAFVLALYGLGDGEIKNARWVYQLYPDLVREKVHQLLDIPASKALLDTELQSRALFNKMPASRQLVRSGKIDVFGFEHGITLLNDMNYRPRPVGGGAFSTFTSYLMRLNGAFMDDPRRRPDFFLVKYQTVDNRLASQDDPLTFLGLLDHYVPVLVEQGYLLFEQNPRPMAASLEVIGNRTVRFNEEVEVPAVPPDQMVLATFDIKPSLSGRARTALHKPPLIYINQLGKKLANGESRRLVPSMTELPIPLSPVIEDNDDVLGLYTRDEGKTLYRFRVATNVPSAYSPDIKVTFYRRARPPLPERIEIDEILTSSRYPLTNVKPERINPADAPLRMIGGVYVQMMMPPTELIWKLEGNERELLFDYGYDPTAYLRGMSNGTILVVEIRPPNLPPLEVFRVKLDPSHNRNDRDSRRARIVLPGSIRAGSRLVVRTDPGENNDSAWDWAYVTKIQLKRGAYSKRQFPGFNRVPVNANTEYASLLDTDTGKILQLHAPGFLDFQLRPTDRLLRFSYGFFPGAYTGQGSTDGATYTVELIRPNQAREVLFRRYVEPRVRVEDQGRQHAEVTLPLLGPADHLILTIDPGPVGNNSWDWTYVTDFELK
jgi:hypothetical protein